MLLPKMWVNNEIKEEKGKHLKTNKNGNTAFQNLGVATKSNSKREVHSDAGLPQEIRKISNNLIYQLKELEEEEERKLKVGRRKEIIMIREETNEIDIKKQQKNQ